MWRYQSAQRKVQWPTTHALNVAKHGGFEPGRALAAFAQSPAARNTVRLKAEAKAHASYVVD